MSPFLTINAFTIGLFTFCLAFTSLVATPSNDYFANVITLTGNNGAISGSNVGLTGGAGEPKHYYGHGRNSSVWYRWIPAISEQAVINMVGSNFDIQGPSPQKQFPSNGNGDILGQPATTPASCLSSESPRRVSRVEAKRPLAAP